MDPSGYPGRPGGTYDDDLLFQDVNLDNLLPPPGIGDWEPLFDTAGTFDDAVQAQIDRNINPSIGSTANNQVDSNVQHEVDNEVGFQIENTQNPQIDNRTLQIGSTYAVQDPSAQTAQSDLLPALQHGENVQGHHNVQHDELLAFQEQEVGNTRSFSGHHPAETQPYPYRDVAEPQHFQYDDTETQAFQYQGNGETQPDTLMMGGDNANLHGRSDIGGMNAMDTDSGIVQDPNTFNPPWNASLQNNMNTRGNFNQEPPAFRLNQDVTDFNVPGNRNLASAWDEVIGNGEDESVYQDTDPNPTMPLGNDHVNPSLPDPFVANDMGCNAGSTLRHPQGDIQQPDHDAQQGPFQSRLVLQDKHGNVVWSTNLPLPNVSGHGFHGSATFPVFQNMGGQQQFAAPGWPAIGTGNQTFLPNGQSILLTTGHAQGQMGIESNGYAFNTNIGGFDQHGNQLPNFGAMGQGAPMTSRNGTPVSNVAVPLPNMYAPAGNVLNTPITQGNTAHASNATPVQPQSQSRNRNSTRPPRVRAVMPTSGPHQRFPANIPPPQQSIALGRGRRSGLDQLAFFGDDTVPRTMFPIRVDRGRTGRAASDEYPASDEILPARLSLEEICRLYPNHVWGSMLRIFMAESWTAEGIWQALPAGYRHAEANTRPWNYIQAAFGREVDQMTREETGKKRVPQKRKADNDSDDDEKKDNDGNAGGSAGGSAGPAQPTASQAGSPLPKPRRGGAGAGAVAGAGVGRALAIMPALPPGPVLPSSSSSAPPASQPAGPSMDNMTVQQLQQGVIQQQERAMAVLVEIERLRNSTTSESAVFQATRNAYRRRQGQWTQMAADRYAEFAGDEDLAALNPASLLRRVYMMRNPNPAEGETMAVYQNRITWIAWRQYLGLVRSWVVEFERQRAQMVQLAQDIYAS
ncbi:hypothetical protein A1O1_07885 [Capronia coronata CBS 617.96]|uniref:Uncharacterized protein n=1 Tax=Capronia coronata CBS 617.96 TaxID=1182541 RepID=W9XWT4_9EURO|nr:uncharacterized protein A1O1_07885 [Capronia coronata CBS 617.96]EXJ81820.1 hypothetical protein A1O1_07885 [Capronia coronata CBS 617.96]